jgi:hypothetical protein
MQMARMPNADNRLLRLVGWLDSSQQPVVYELVRTDGIRTDSSAYGSTCAMFTSDKHE